MKLLVFFLFVLSLRAVADCSTFLENMEQLVAYFSTLVEKGTLTQKDLQEMQSVFHETGEVKNPFVLNKQVSSERDTHLANIDYYLDSLSNEEKLGLMSWLDHFLEAAAKISQVKDETQAKTKVAYLKINFVRFKANAYVGDGAPTIIKKIANYFKYHLDEVASISHHDFEIMDAPVTQAQWAEVMGDNPSDTRLQPSRSHEKPIMAFFNGTEVEMFPDWPVSRVPFIRTLEYANKMSELHHLQPVYDISKFPEIKINAPGGDIYKAEGYRFPTGNEMHVIFNGDKDNKIANYNTSKMIFPNNHQNPVDEQLFVTLPSGESFYYIMGNSEWLSVDMRSVFFKDNGRLINVENRSGDPHYRIYNPSMEDGENANLFTSFRLVRTLLKKKNGAKL